MTQTVLSRPRVLGVSGEFGGDERVTFPMTAQWTGRDTCLIVDRGGPLNRVLEVDRAGNVLWTREAPPRLNAAHRLDETRVLLAQDATLSINDGELCRLPGVFAFDSLDAREDLIAAGSDAGIDLVSMSGSHLRRIPCDRDIFTNPTGVQLLSGGRMLVADSWDSRVVELSPEGVLLRRLGRRRSAGSEPDCLSGPRSACRTRDGRTIVADTLANRLVEFSADGEARVLPAPVVAPTFVRETPSGDLLVADTGRRRVVLLDRSGRQLWAWGATSFPDNLFAFPRSAEAVPGGGALVCDTFHHRIVEVSADNRPVWTFHDGLVIPRSASRCADGRTVIADGVNGRILVVSPAGRIQREVVGGLGDPHHATEVDGMLLVVDSDLEAVLLIDEHDRVVRQWRGQFADPHHAALDPRGRLLVADSGHGRVVLLDGDQVVWEKRGLRYPRFASFFHGGILVADTDHSRVLVLDTAGRTLRVIGPLVDGLGEIRTPRWVSPGANGELFITDYWNNRVAIIP